MTSNDSENPNDTLPPAAEGLQEGSEIVPETEQVAGRPEAAPPPSDSATSRLPEHTAETRENQEQATRAGKLERRMRDVTALMIEKERYQLQYVCGKIPKPYYDRWKAEGNELFSLMVQLRRRRRRMRKSGS